MNRAGRCIISSPAPKWHDKTQLCHRHYTFCDSRFTTATKRFRIWYQRGVTGKVFIYTLVRSQKLTNKPVPQFPSNPNTVGNFDTPATVKFERIKLWDLGDAVGYQDDMKCSKTGTWSALHGRRTRDSDTASKPGEDEKPSVISISSTARHPCSQIVPCHRPTRPPLKNTSGLCSVDQNLLELPQIYNIDDSASNFRCHGK